MKAEWKVGTRVYVKPYNCFRKVVKVAWREELKLSSNLAIPEGFTYWVKLEGKDLKPRGFSKQMDKINYTYKIK